MCVCSSPLLIGVDDVCGFERGGFKVLLRVAGFVEGDVRVCHSVARVCVVKPSGSWGVGSREFHFV